MQGVRSAHLRFQAQRGCKWYAPRPHGAGGRALFSWCPGSARFLSLPDSLRRGIRSPRLECSALQKDSVNLVMMRFGVRSVLLLLFFLSGGAESTELA